ncbi:Endo/exonuclease amino terminal GIY-YIG domain protein [Leuconostoc citreum]|nr:Endo/exonuclease amino terminal GIY-YIG domain protein [Leuconostoc citreum]
MMAHYYFYVLYTADGYFYGGFTNNLAKRLAAHEAGKGAKFTRVKSRHPLQMIHSESFDTKHEALHAEAMFKQLTRQQKEAYLVLKGVSEDIWH